MRPFEERYAAALADPNTAILSAEAIDYSVAVSDRESTSISAENMRVQPVQIHNSHTHALDERRGPTGTIRVQADDSHGPYVIDRALKLEATYTDDGGSDTPKMTGSDHVLLQPKRKQAEHTSQRHGAARQITGPIRDRTFYSFLQGSNGDYGVYQPVNFYRIDSVTVRVASEAGGTLQMRLDAPDGPVLTELKVPATAQKQPSADEQGNPEEGGGDDDGPRWEEITAPITNPGGTRALYLVFSDIEDDGNVKVDWMEFHGVGVK